MPPKEKELNKNGVIGRVESVNVPRNFADQLKRHHLRYVLLLSVYARIWLIPLSKYRFLKFTFPLINY